MLNLILVFSLLLTAFASAANKYVVPGGSGSGASWSSPAGTSIINSSGAGDIVYLAGGSYGDGIPVTASGSASSPLTIKRATGSDHGSDTGWSSSMDSQAVFTSGWYITGKYITVDGNCWKPPGLPTIFGISIKHGSGSKGIDAGGSGGYLTVRDVDIIGPGFNSSTQEADGIHFPDNSLISGCASHDTDALLFSWNPNSNSVIEYCVLYNASSAIVTASHSGPHPDVWYTGSGAKNSVVRWCLVANVVSEGFFFDQNQAGDNMTWYGCIFMQGDTQSGAVPIEFQNGYNFGRVFIYNCTFCDYGKSNYLGPGTTVAAGSAFKNNLWINCVTNFSPGMDNNGFSFGATGSNSITNTASPFVTTGDRIWVKGSGNPPATRVVTGIPQGYNPVGYESAFNLSPNSWASGKAVTVPAGYNVHMLGRIGNNLGAMQSGGTGGAPTPSPSSTPVPIPTSTPVPTATPAPAPTATPGAKFKSGDTVTPTAAVNVRQGSGGPVVGVHNPGEIGTIQSGPEFAPLPQAKNVEWYLISWTSAPLSGSTGADDLSKISVPAPTPTPVPKPTPVETYLEWTAKLHAEQSKWIQANPPYPDGE